MLFLSLTGSFQNFVNQCNPTCVFLSALATFGDAGEFRRALTLFTQMKKSASLFSAMSAADDDEGDRGGGPASSPDGAAHSGGDGGGEEAAPTASATLQSIDLVLDPPKPTLVTYSTLMSRAVSLGKPRVALRLWNLMTNQPNYYSNAISRRQRADRRVIDARADPSSELVDARDVIVPDAICCNILMNAYAKLGDHVAARSVLNAMLGLGGAEWHVHGGIPPTGVTVVTYNTLADACKSAGELGAALEVVELMTSHAGVSGDSSLLPDIRTYTSEPFAFRFEPRD